MARSTRRTRALLRYLSKPQTLGLLGISERTLTRWTERGLINKIRVGPRRVLYNADQVERLARGQS